MDILVLIIAFILLLIAISLISGLWHGAPYMPTSKSAIRSMLKLAKTKADDVVLDLGSGDGRTLVIIAEEFGARGLGVEITWFYYFWSRVKVALKGLSRQVTIRHEDMYMSDISEASVVVLFLLQDTNQKLKDKLIHELKPGTRIVSHYFTFDNWEPKAKDEKYYTYLYVVPERNN